MDCSTYVAHHLCMQCCWDSLSCRLPPKGITFQLPLLRSGLPVHVSVQKGIFVSFALGAAGSLEAYTRSLREQAAQSTTHTKLISISIHMKPKVVANFGTYVCRIEGQKAINRANIRARVWVGPSLQARD